MPWRHGQFRHGAAIRLMLRLWLAACLATLTACASAQPTPIATDNPAPDQQIVESALEPVSAQPEATRALELDGDRRVAEPVTAPQRRDLARELDPWTMPLAERFHPRLHTPATRGSISVGTVTAGFLVEGVALPLESTQVRVLDRVVARNTRYTTVEMAKLLHCAAEHVVKSHPGAVLQLGNLSRQGGGPLPWSVSHHNGRDADIAFYVRDAKGNLARMDRLYHFDTRGRATDAGQPLTFDVAANWSLVEGLIKCDDDKIQFLFVADWLKQAMLAHARGEDAQTDRKGRRKRGHARHAKPAASQIIARAEALLLQPKRTLPHNDHLHLRIGCIGDDRAEGCVDASRAPIAAWSRTAAVQARLPALRQSLRSASADERRSAVYLLGLYRDDASLAGLGQALNDAVPTVRLQAARTLAQWQASEAAQWLATALASEQDARVAVALLSALAELRAVPQLVEACKDRRAIAPPTDSVDVPLVVVRKMAASLLGDSASLQALPGLVALLTDADPRVRDASRTALERLTNVSTADLQMGRPEPAQPLEPEGELALWTSFVQGLPAGASRDEVALRGLQRHGVAVQDLDRKALPGLTQALGMPAPWRDNAARWLEKIVSFRPEVGRGARATPLQFWSQFLVQRKLIAGSELAARLAAATLTTQTEAIESASPGGSSTAPAADSD